MTARSFGRPAARSMVCARSAGSRPVVGGDEATAGKASPQAARPVTPRLAARSSRRITGLSSRVGTDPSGLLQPRPARDAAPLDQAPQPRFGSRHGPDRDVVTQPNSPG